MRSSWRRSTALILALTVAMLLGLAGMASAAVTGVVIVSPTASNPVYCKAGTMVTVGANITAPAGEEIYMSCAVGSNTAAAAFVGTGTGTPTLFSRTITLDGGEDEGWKSVTASAYTNVDSTAWNAIPTAGVCVDNTPPTPPGAFIDPGSPDNDETPTWSWGESTDALSGIDHYDILID